jgi:hypothetical protein
MRAFTFAVRTLLEQSEVEVSVPSGEHASGLVLPLLLHVVIKCPTKDVGVHCKTEIPSNTL